jgi:hypothetical protein
VSLTPHRLRAEASGHQVCKLNEVCPADLRFDLFAEADELDVKPGSAHRATQGSASPAGQSDLCAISI